MTLSIVGIKTATSTLSSTYYIFKCQENLQTTFLFYFQIETYQFNSWYFLFQNGQTPLSIAQKLGYITVIETLKVVTTTTTITTTTTTNIEEKYKVQAPELMHETFMSDSEEEGGKIYIIYSPCSFALLVVLQLDGNQFTF